MEIKIQKHGTLEYKEFIKCRNAVICMRDGTEFTISDFADILSIHHEGPINVQPRAANMIHVSVAEGYEK